MRAAHRLFLPVVFACALAAGGGCDGGKRVSMTGGPGGTAGTAGTGGGGGAVVVPPGELRRAAAAAGKFLGAAVDATALRDDTSYATLLAREFDYVTPENATKWGPL